MVQGELEGAKLDSLGAEATRIAQSNFQPYQTCRLKPSVDERLMVVYSTLMITVVIQYKNRWPQPLVALV